MDLAIAGKVALITGGSRGLGRVTALAYGREGAKVAINFHQNEAKAQEVVQAIEATGSQALAIQAELTEPAAANGLVEAVVSRWGTVDILVNNAVYFAETPMEDLKLEDWQVSLQTNLTAALLLIHACLPHMKKQGWGRIVNLSSRSGIMGAARQVAYSASKAGLVGLTRTLAKELGPYGILVNAVAPTLMMTEVIQASMSDKAKEDAAKRNPLRRLAGPEDVAPVILFLGSGWNTYVNGEVITVGGGVQS